jgi:hypothetical protein
MFNDLELTLDTLKDNSVKSLVLTQKYIDDDAIELISAMLKENVSLTFIDLSDNPISVKGLQKLSKALSCHPQLQKLVLTDLWNRDRPKGPEYITALLPLFKNPQLKELSLSLNAFDSTAFLQLAEILKKNKTLRLLEIYQGKLSDSEDAALASAINRNKVLILEVNHKGHSKISKCNDDNKALQKEYDEAVYLYSLVECNLTEDGIFEDISNRDEDFIKNKRWRREDCLGYRLRRHLYDIQYNTQVERGVLPPLSTYLCLLAIKKAHDIKQKGYHPASSLLNHIYLQTNNPQIVSHFEVSFRMAVVIKNIVRNINLFFSSIGSLFYNSENKKNEAQSPKNFTVLKDKEDIIRRSKKSHVSEDNRIRDNSDVDEIITLNRSCSTFFIGPIKKKPTMIAFQSYKLARHQSVQAINSLEAIDTLYREVLFNAAEQFVELFSKNLYSPKFFERAAVEGLISDKESNATTKNIINKIATHLKKNRPGCCVFVCGKDIGLVFKTFLLILNQRKREREKYLNETVGVSDVKLTSTL